MDPALANLGWTEDHWHRICSTVAEEAQRARVAAQALPVVGTDDPNAISIPGYRTAPQADPYPYAPAVARLSVNSAPTLQLTTISVNVSLRSHEVADARLEAALVMFRRAANHIARIEDALVFNGRLLPNTPPAGLAGIPPIYRVRGDGSTDGIFAPPIPGVVFPAPLPPNPTGNHVVNRIIEAINLLEGGGELGPFTSILSNRLFELLSEPQQALVMPRDRILPFLQGPLLRSSLIGGNRGCVIALSGNPVELVVAKDVSVRYLQSTPESRYVFRISEKVALRIKEPQAIAILT